MLSAARCLRPLFRTPAASLVRVRPLVEKRSVHLGRSRLRAAETFEVNTKVSKDVILFQYENPRFFKMLNLFGLSQFAFWSYLCYCATTLKNVRSSAAQDDGTTPWWQSINLGEKKYKIGLMSISFFVGYGILASSWLYTMRAVRYLILRKGGTNVTLICYAPFGENRTLNVPLKHISCQQSRQVCKVQLPLKVKNLRMHYILDMKGDFRNTKLFDNTVGLKRNLS